MGANLKKTKVKAVHSILEGQDSALNRLYQQKNRVDRLNKAIQQRLPASYKGHVQVINLKAGKLTLGVTNSSLAQALHFEKSELLSALRKDPMFCDLVSIEHKIAITPPALKVATGAKRAKKISKNISCMLKALLANTKAPILKKSVQRLLDKLSESKA